MSKKPYKLENSAVRFQILSDKSEQEIARYSLQEHVETWRDHKPPLQMEIPFFRNILPNLVCNALVKLLKRRYIKFSANPVPPLIHILLAEKYYPSE